MSLLQRIDEIDYVLSRKGPIEANIEFVVRRERDKLIALNENVNMVAERLRDWQADTQVCVYIYIYIYIYILYVLYIYKQILSLWSGERGIN